MALYDITKQLQDKHNQKTQEPTQAPLLFKDIIKQRGTIMDDADAEAFPSSIPIGHQPKAYERRLGKFYDPTIVDEDYLAHLQSNGERALKIVPRVATKVLSEVLQMPGYIVGAANWATTGFKPEEIGKMVDNAWIQAIQAKEEKFKEEALGVYTSNAIKEGSLWDNVFSSAFWANEGADGIGFLMAFLVPGMAVRALGAGDKLAKALGKGAKFAGLTDDVAATALNTVFESAAEAGESYREVLDRYLSKTDDEGNPLYNNNEASEIAGKVAVGTMRKNFGILLASNALEQKWLFNAFPGAGKGLDAATHRAKRSVLQRVMNKDFSKVLDDVIPLTRGQRAGRITQNLFQNALREGFWEEGMQELAPQISEMQVTEEEDQEFGHYLLETLDLYYDSMFDGDPDVDMQKSVFLGATLGSIMGGIQTSAEMGREKRMLEGTPARKATPLQRAFNIQDREETVGLHKLMKENYLTRFKTVQDVTTFNEETGKYDYDEAKLKEAGAQLIGKNGLKTMMQAAAQMGNKEGYEAIKAKIDSDYMLPFLQVNGGLDVLKAHVNTLAEQVASETEGTMVESQVEEIQKDLLEKADRYNNIYNRISDTNENLINIPHEKADQTHYDNFVDSIKHNKLSGEFIMDLHKDRIDKLTEELNDYKSGNKIVPISSISKLPGKQMVKELTDSLNEHKAELSQGDVNDIQKKIKAIEAHSESLENAQENMKKLYDKKFLKNNYKSFLANVKASTQESTDGKSDAKKNVYGKNLPDNLNNLYKNAVEFEEFSTQKGKYDVVHSAEIAVSYKDDQGRTLTQTGRLSRKPEDVGENLKFIVEKEQSYNEDGELITQDTTGKTISVLNEDSFQHRGTTYPIDVENDITITKSVQDVKQDLEKDALISAIENVLNQEKKQIREQENKLLDASEQLDYIMEQATKLQEKEMQSLEETGTVLTKKGTQRVQLVKILRNNGKTIQKLYMNLEDIQNEVNKIQDGVTGVENHINTLKLRIETLTNEKNKIQKLGRRAVPFLDKSIAHINSLIANSEGSVQEANTKIEETNTYIQQLENVLSGYFTTAANILGMKPHITAIKNNPRIAPENKNKAILNLLTKAMNQKKFSQDEFMNLGAGKLLTEGQWEELNPQMAEPYLADISQLEQLGKLPENIRRINALIQEHKANLPVLQDALVEQQQSSTTLQRMLEAKTEILSQFRETYKQLLISENIAQRIPTGQTKPTPENMFGNMRSTPWEFEARHPYSGVDNWLISQGDQQYAPVNSDVARWYIFVNNYARYKNNDGSAKYTAQTFTFEQAGQLPENHIVRQKLKFFVGTNSKGEPILKTYDEILNSPKYYETISEQSADQKEIKTVIFEGNKPLETSPAGHLNPDSQKNIFFSALSLPTGIYRDSGETRFSIRNLQEKHSQQEIDQILKKDLERYKEMRDEMIEKSQKLFVKSVNPGVKVEADNEQEVMDALKIKHPKLIHLYIPSVKNDESDYLNGSKKHLSGTEFTLQNGFPHIGHDNRYEQIKPKTLHDTGDVDNIINLMRAINNKHENSTQILQYIKNALYLNNLDNPYSFDIINEFVNGRPVPGTIKKIIFGDHEIKAEDLNDAEAIKPLQTFLAAKYWNFNKQLVGDKVFMEYRAGQQKDEIKVQKIEWTEKDGGYKGFLFDTKKNNQPKGTVQIKPLEKDNVLHKAQNPQYINQSINFTTQESERMFKSTKKQAAPPGSTPTKKGSGTQSTDALFGDAPMPTAEDQTSDSDLGFGPTPIPPTSSEGGQSTDSYFGDATEASETEESFEDGLGFNKNFGNNTEESTPKSFNQSENTTNPKPEGSSQAMPWEKLPEGMRNMMIGTHGSETAAKEAYEKATNIDNDLNRPAIEQDKYEMENIEESISWFQNKFPDIPIQVVEGLVNNRLWGQFNQGARVLLSNIAASGTVHHESFHVFTQLFLPEDELNSLYEETRKELNNSKLTDTQAEEYLAEEFRMFMLSPSSYSFSKQATKTKSWFQKLVDVILEFFGIQNREDNTLEERLEQFSNLKDDVFPQARQIKTSTASLNRVANLTEKETFFALQDMNFKFFQSMFKNFDADILFKSDDRTEINKIYQTIYDKYQIDLYNTKDEFTAKILNNWTELIKEHIRFVKQYNVKIPLETNEFERSSDTVSYKESLTVNMSELIPDPIRLLIAGLPSVTMTKGKLEPTISKYGTKSTAAFNKMITLLKDQLSDLTNMDQMMDKISQISEQYPELELLRKRLKTDKDKPSTSEFVLQNMFFRSFAHNKNIPQYLIYAPDGQQYWSNASIDNQSKLLKNKWLTKAKQSVGKKWSYIEKTKNGDYTINISKFRESYRENLQGDKQRGVLNTLAGLGITFTTVDRFTNAQDIETAEKYLFRLDEQLKALPKHYSLKLDDLHNEDIIQNQKELNQLVGVALKHNLNDYDLMYYNHEGNPEYAIALNSHVTNTKNQLNQLSRSYIGDLGTVDEIPDEIAHLQPYNKDTNEGSLFSMHSQWWDAILEGSNLEVVLLKGYTTYTGKGSDIESGLPGDYKAITFNAILNNTIPLLRAADRRLEYAFRIKEGPREVTSPMMKSMMNNYLKDELLTSFAYFANPQKYGGQLNNYKNNIQELRTFNFLYNDKYISNRLRKRPPSLKDFYALNTDEQTTNPDNINRLEDLVNTYLTEYKSYINSVFSSYLNEMEELTLESLKNDNIIYEKRIKSSSGKISSSYYPVGIDTATMEDTLQIYPTPFGNISKKEVDNIIRVALYNNFIGTQEQLKLFVGDIANYANMKEFHKRVTGAVSTKYNTANSLKINQQLEELYPRFDGKTRDGNINQAIVDDISISNSDLNHISEDYKDINITDAQSWIGLDEYRDWQLRHGPWNEGHDKTYQYEMQKFALRALENPSWELNITNETFTDGMFAEHTNGTVPTTPMYKGKEISIAELTPLTIIKPQGFGRIPGMQGLQATQMFKTSTAPIFPSALADDSIMLKKYIQMIKKKQDILTFKSAHKGDILTNEQGEIQSINDESWVTQPIRYEDIGIQLDIHEEEADQVTISTQRTRLEFIDMFAFGELTPENAEYRAEANEYEQLIKDSVAQERYNLLQRLGLEKVSNSNQYHLPQENVEKFKEQLLKVFEHRLLPRNTLDAITLALESDNKYFDIMIGSNKVEEVLTAMVRDSVISRKTSGDMFIQESSLLYENEIPNESTDSRLKFYRMEDGIVKPMQVMISLPQKWIPWVESIGGLDVLNKAIKAKDYKKLGKNFFKLLNVVSNRIPAQGLNSLEAMEIVEFLPHYHGPKVVLPPGITVKSGSDFDVDKLTSYLNSTVMMGTDIQKPTYLDYNPEKYTDFRTKRMHNRMNEIAFKTTLASSRFESLVRPNNTKYMKSLSEQSKQNRTLNRLEQAEDTATSSELTQWWFNIQKGIEFWNSKAGIEQAAVHNVAHALEQKYPLIMNPAVQLYFRGNEVSEGYYTSGFVKDSADRNISENFAELLSSFVDAVKDPFIFEIVDNFTFKSLAVLNRFGVNEGIGMDSIAALLTQDIVKDYLKIRKANMGQHMVTNQYNTTYDQAFQGRFSSNAKLSQSEWYAQAVNNIADKLNLDLNDVNNSPLDIEDSLFYFIRKWNNKEATADEFNEYVQKEGAYGYKYFSAKQLRDLNTTIPTSKEGKIEAFKDQVQALDNFLSYMEIGTQLNKVNKILRPDAKSTLSKQLVTLDNKLNNQMEAVEPLFVPAPIRDSLETSMLSEFHKTQQETVNMFQWTSMLLSDDTLNEFTTHMSNYFKGKKFSQNPIDQDKIMTTVKSHLFTFLITDSLNMTNKQMQGFYKAMFLANNSVPIQLMKYKQRSLDNIAISELEPVIKSRQKRFKSMSPLHNIATFSKRYDVHEADAIEADLYDLWENGTPDDAKFVARLLFHALYQGGLTGGTNTYLKFIPNRIFNDIAQNTINKFQSLDTADKQLLLQRFHNQFFRNNAHDPLITPRSLFVAKKVKGIGTKSNSEIGKYSTDNDYFNDVKFYSENYFGTRPNNKLAKPSIGIALYEQIENTGKFKLAARLGESIRMFEYYPKADNDQLAGLSLLPANKYKKPTITDYLGTETEASDMPNYSMDELDPGNVDEINSQIDQISKRDRKYRGGPRAQATNTNEGYNKYSKYLESNPTVNNLLRVISKTAESENHRNLASQLRSVMNIPFKLSAQSPESFDGWGEFTFERGYKDPTIYYRSDLESENFENTILHEALHGVTLYGYINNTEFKNKVDKLYQHVMNFDTENIDALRPYINSPVELLTYGLVDPSAQKVLQDLPGITADNKPSVITALRQFLETILEFISGGLYQRTNQVADITAFENLTALVEPYLEEIQGEIETPISSDELMMELYQEGYAVSTDTLLKSLGKIESWDDIVGNQTINNTKIKYYQDSRSAELAKDAFSRLPNVKVAMSERPGERRGKYVVRITKTNLHSNTPQTSKTLNAERNFNEFRKLEGMIDPTTQDILDNFTKYYPGLEYLNSYERFNFVNALTQGEIEQLC